MLGWTTNADGEVIEDIPSFRRFTGQTFEEVKGWGWTKALHPDDLEQTTKTWQKAIREKVDYEIEYRLRRFDGVYRYFLARGVPLFSKGRHVREWVGTCIDITEHKKVEELKDEFIGMVSHELKTPITVIMGSLHTLTSIGLSEEEKFNLIQESIASTETMTGIVENLLELSRSQANRLNLHEQLEDVGFITRTVARKFSSRSAMHTLKVNIPRGLPRVMVDPIRIDRILFNLVENAIKYSPKGGEVKISVRRKDDDLVVCVRDQGPGISADDQKKLFQSFEQLGINNRRAMQGVGLGLKVCRTLVEAHNGRIWVESQLGKGAAFCFTLPIRTSAA
jgi:PAS domain S-box-containing protein